jgi:hypothetical protein
LGGYWVCDACLSLNDPRTSACYRCHVKRGQARPQPLIPGATAGPSASIAYGTGARPLGEPSALLALAFGLVVTVLATAGWYWLEAGIRFGQGRIAWLVGFIVASSVVFAGTMAGHRRISFILPVISLALTLAAVVVGEYLIISAALASGAGIDPAGSIPVAQPEDVARVVAEYWASDPLRPVLWLVALATAWLVPWGLLVGSDDRDRDHEG